MSNNNFIFIFKVFGLNMIRSEDSKTRTSDNIRKMLSAFYISWCIFLLILQYVVQDQLYYVTEILGMMTDMLQTVLPLSSHLVSLVTAITKRNHHRKLHEKLSEIYDDLNAKCMYKNDAIKSSRKCFIMFVGFCFVNQVTILLLPKHNLWTFSLLVRASSEFIIRLNDFQYLFYVLQLNHVYKTMNGILKNAANPEEFSKSHSNDMTSLKKLTNNIWKAADLIKKRFGLSLVFTVTTNFVVVLSSAYWISFKVKRRAYINIPLTLTSIFLIFSPIVNLIALFFVSANCMKNVIIAIDAFYNSHLMILIFSLKNWATTYTTSS